MRWSPSIELSPSETKLCKRLEKHRRFYRFLRLHRRALFDDAMQARLASMYAGEHPGDKPVAPALLGMVTLLQAYAGASDADAVQNAETDLRWQLPLDCIGCVLAGVKKRQKAVSNFGVERGRCRHLVSKNGDERFGEGGDEKR